MNYFTIRRRLKVLNEFKENYSKWRKTVQQLDWPTFSAGDQKLRAEVNALIPEAAEAFDSLGSRKFLSYPAPAVGGPVLTFHPIQDCLLLDQLSMRRISTQLIIDEIDKSVAVYKRKIIPAFLNLFNPLYWVWCILVFVLRIPFIVLDAVGFTNFSRKAESSIYGKFAKLLIFIGIIRKLLSIAADLQTFGFLHKIWSYVKGLL